MARKFRRRFSIVGKEFDPSALKQSIDALDENKSAQLKDKLRSLWSMVETLLDEKGAFQPRMKPDRLWYLAHALDMDLAEYRHLIDKLQEALDLLTDKCPDEWYDSEDHDED